jgi:hypothetical protein
MLIIQPFDSVPKFSRSFCGLPIILCLECKKAQSRFCGFTITVFKSNKIKFPMNWDPDEVPVRVAAQCAGA